MRFTLRGALQGDAIRKSFQRQSYIPVILAVFLTEKMYRSENTRRSQGRSRSRG